MILSVTLPVVHSLQITADEVYLLGASWLLFLPFGPNSVSEARGLASSNSAQAASVSSPSFASELAAHPVMRCVYIYIYIYIYIYQHGGP